MYISLTAGEDYNVTQQSLVIPAGSTSSSYSIDIINDMIHEDDETFEITLTISPTCLSISVDNSSAAVTIFDNDGKLLKLYVSLSPK